jgi:hypothetical protein
MVNDFLVEAPAIHAGVRALWLPAMDSIKFAWKEERYKIYAIMP